ncbi:MAG: UvrD-helicase domain-containing protein [Deltaproteobacteria bacterium]|nr:UvrD-helicase domain-containing protein [Deltaproteobacteria bacterium]
MSRFPLNPKQKEAVLHKEGPLLILAGAGSGKTRVLVERMIHLIREERVSPWNLFAVTFTNKAAREMKNRVMESLGPAAQDLWISTFHSSCLRILRRHAEDLGFEKAFAIYDDSDQKTALKKVVADLNLSDKIYKPKTIQFHINRAKNEGLGPEDFATEGDHFLTKVHEIFTIYQKELKRNNAMDFGDLINYVLKLFTNKPEILGHYQEKFKFIMVDEYQDTNLCQYKLIKLLASKYKNVCVVGDDDQSIYKFRGAEIRNILDFQKDYPDAKCIRLEQNYRSTQTILNAANAVIRGNKGRMGKELWTENNDGDSIKVFGGMGEKDEAKFVVGRIKELREEHALKDFAVFYRTNAQSRAFEDEMRRNRLAYKIFGGTKFYDRMEIKDMMAYLKVLVNPADAISLKRVINVPARGIGKTTVDKIEDLATQKGISFWETLCQVGDPALGLNVNAGTAKKLSSFVAIVQKINRARAEMPLSDFLPYLYETSGYWQMLDKEKTIENESRKENLTELSSVLDEYIDMEEVPTLEGFLDQISLASGVDELDEGDDFVTLMTIHLAKGLEFPVVFLVGLEEGIFPHNRSLDNQEDLEEERRLCYVGMTRAEKKLHLSFVNERKIFGTNLYNFPSRFLEEIPSEFVETVTLEEDDDKPWASASAMMNRKKLYEERNQQNQFDDGWSQPVSYGQGNRSEPYAKPYRAQQAGQRQGGFRQATRAGVSNTIKRKPAARNETTIDLEYAQTEGMPIKKGARVRHAVFGDGNVLGFEGADDKLKIMVKFKTGVMKKLLYKHAHLEVLR